MPNVAVVIPAPVSNPYFESALRSALGQSLPPALVVVVATDEVAASSEAVAVPSKMADTSAENSLSAWLARLQPFAAERPNVPIQLAGPVVSAGAVGGAAAWNLGIRAALGEAASVLVPSKPVARADSTAAKVTDADASDAAPSALPLPEATPAAVALDYVSLLLPEDLYAPKRLAQGAAWLKGRPKYDVAVTGLVLVADDGERLAPEHIKVSQLRTVWAEPDCPPAEWLGRAYFPHAASNFFARADYLRAHPFREDFPFRAYRHGPDFYFALLAALEGKLTVIDEPLLACRTAVGRGQEVAGDEEWEEGGETVFAKTLEPATPTIKIKGMGERKSGGLGNLLLGRSAPKPELKALDGQSQRRAEAAREVMRLNLALLREIAPRLRESAPWRDALMRYFRALAENGTAFRVEIFLALVAGTLVQPGGEPLAALEAMTPGAFPELAEPPSLEARMAREEAQLNEFRRHVMRSRWMALGMALGFVPNIFRRRGDQPATQLAKLQCRFSFSGWVWIGRLFRFYRDFRRE